MKTITCDKCGKKEAFYFLNMRDPFKEDTKEKARSLKRDLCRDCAKELATSLGLTDKVVPSTIVLTEEQSINLAGEASQKIIEMFRNLAADGVYSHELEYCLEGYLEEYGKKCIATAKGEV